MHGFMKTFQYLDSEQNIEQCARKPQTCGIHCCCHRTEGPDVF